MKKLDNRLFELNSALKFEVNQLKTTNQQLLHDNSELYKSPGAQSSSSGAYPHEKIRLLDEQLLKAKDEVIDLQKKLVDVTQFFLSNKTHLSKNLLLNIVFY